MKTFTISSIAFLLFCKVAFGQVGASIVITDTIGTFAPGSRVAFDCLVTNTSSVGSALQAFGVGAELITSSGTYEAPPGETGTLSPGSYDTVPIYYTTPSTLPIGSGTAHVVVWSGVPAGNGTNLSFGQKIPGNFQLVAIQEASPLAGRLCCQVYSAYLATESTNSTLDGNLLLYNLSTSATSSLTGTSGTQNAVQNCVNPHFSPDGAKIVFAGMPKGLIQSGTGQNGDSYRVFLYDLAQLTLIQLTTGTTRDEDASFSPDGEKIVFKRTPSTSTTTGQIWTMNCDGSGTTQLTFTSDEKSGPNYSPDGSTIVYYSGAGSNATICAVSATSGSDTDVLVSSSNIESYYPFYDDANDILYVSWTSMNNETDEIYDYTINADTAQLLTSNFSNGNNSDPFPVNTADANLVGFSNNQTGSYVPYLGDPSTGMDYSLPYVSSTLNELGGTYTPYSYSRELIVLSPTSGSILTAGTSLTVQVQGLSDGGAWNGATPMVMLSSSNTGQSLGEVGSAFYSGTITMPQVAGSYALSVSATSYDNLPVLISSSSVIVTVVYRVSTSSSLDDGGTTSGGGSFSSGATATVVATPSVGYEFAGWMSNGVKVSSSASYSFTVNENENLVANFALIDHLPGTYDGLLDDWSGYCTTSLSASGKFTGKLIIDGTAHSFKGVLNYTGGWQGATSNGSLPISLQFAGGSIENPASFFMTGSGNGTAMTVWHSAYAKGQPVQEAGRYVLELTSTASGVGIPSGSGKATLIVNKSGNVKLSGRLPDGTSFSTSGAIVGGTSGDQCFIYARINYRNAKPGDKYGYLIGDLTFPLGGVAGPLLWKKPEQTRGAYPASFDTYLNIFQ